MCKTAINDGSYIVKYNYITHFYQLFGNNLISFSTLETVIGNKLTFAQLKLDSCKLCWLTAWQVPKINVCGLENKGEYSEHVKLWRNKGNYTLDCFCHVAAWL